MKVKTIVNSKGEPQASKIVIPMEGSLGKTGKQAMTYLTMLINSIQETKTEEEIFEYYYIIAGYAICCKECGFLTEKSLDDLMHLLEHIIDIESERVDRAETAE